MKDRTSGRRGWCAPIERKEPWAAFLGVLILLMFFGSVTSGQDAPPKDVTQKKAANENGGQGEQEGLGSDESSESKESKESSPKTVITATRIETPIEQAGSSITVIESQEIKNRQHLLVGKALRFSPGVAIRRCYLCLFGSPFYRCGFHPSVRG